MLPVRPLALALGATAVAVAAGVALTSVPEDAAPTVTTAPSVSLDELDTTRLAAERAAFCADVPEDAVTEALGGEAVEGTAYGSGDRAELVDGVRDVAHEYSCSWSGADGSLARAWVFAPPVTPAAADALVAAARRTEGCRRDAGAPAYGVPSLALVCQGPDGRERSYRGLFGDAWVTCELSAPTAVTPAVLEERAEAWCAGVVTAVQVAG